MSDFFTLNLQVLARRWPKWHAALTAVEPIAAEVLEGLDATLLVNGRQLTSRHDRQQEARDIAALITMPAPAAALYGIGLGDVPRELLRRPALQQLQVVILNTALFALVLQVTDQRDWLQDPRVVLTAAAEHAQVMTPFTFLTAELALADAASQKLRDRVVVQTKLQAPANQTNAQHERLRLEANLPLIKQDADAAELFNTLVQPEVYVLATGPTLAEHFAWLTRVRKQAVRPLFIAVDTALRPLLAQGIVPDIVVSVDKNITATHLLPEQLAGVPLVYSPLLKTEVLHLWRGPRYVMYEAGNANFAALRRQWPKAELFTGGSVIHPATDLAVRMGAQKITLFGADFAFPSDKTHAGWEDGAISVKADYGRYSVLNGAGESVNTLLSFMIYLNSMEEFIRRHPTVAFYNASRAGAMIAGAAYVDWAALSGDIA
ncbi:MAG: motility associated factor glycosyltransferase family protein [Aeromonas sp.]